MISETLSSLSMAEVKGVLHLGGRHSCGDSNSAGQNILLVLSLKGVRMEEVLWR